MGENISRPMVSVIIPAYRAQDYIENCVNSVCSQVVTEELKRLCGDNDIMEVIIVDDGSTDNTGKICDDLSEKNSIINVIHVKNGGVSKARNLGLERSCGRYIAFVDADDRVEEDYISDMLLTALQADADVVIMDGPIETDDTITGRRYIEDGILSEDTHVWGKFFKRELICDGDKTIRFPENLTIGEDMLFLLDAMIKVYDKPCIRTIEGDGYDYFYNTNGAMLEEFKPSYLDQIRCWELADKKINGLNPGITDEAEVKFSVIKVMAALLVVSKFAKSLNMRENKDELTLAMKEKVVSGAQTLIRNAKSIKGCFRGLSMGYKVKTVLFGISPDLYMKLYSVWKSV
ncbi:glycosyltransferase family 2 protein [Butyrivibrio sp. JL13D10]|uniref:glycosyltransferase family 2 protein n=1 Tax=Butyrivibrio sp. JL13D10 TaxID=3236815 RepID=UPI0038B43A85